MIDEEKVTTGNAVQSNKVANLRTIEDKAIDIVASNTHSIGDLIYTVRGTQVMLDSDLAALYQVETGALNRAAKRNENRFPEDFRFRITKDELDNIRCQIGILAGQDSVPAVGRTYLPYVYTEQGVAMLSAALHSRVAIDTSVRIMRAFVEMRHFIASNAAMFEQIRSVELRQLEYQKTTDERFERVFDYMETHDAPKQKVFFDGQIYDAFELLVSIVRQAGQSITLIDGYVDVLTLNTLAKKHSGVAVTIWTHPRTRLTQRDVATFNAQYPQLSIEHTDTFHDRFIILDNSEGYLCGASLKDAGKKSFAISRIEDAFAVKSILSRLETS
ncbi:MAG: ORF6N domain-containing protein [Atopobiaceae bacterium]|nr:ORF6N domain-containing protein [Atopobiaceae bacterium]